MHDVEQEQPIVRDVEQHEVRESLDACESKTERRSCETEWLSEDRIDDVANVRDEGVAETPRSRVVPVRRVDDVDVE